MYVSDVCLCVCVCVRVCVCVWSSMQSFFPTSHVCRVRARFVHLPCTGMGCDVCVCVDVCVCLCVCVCVQRLRCGEGVMLMEAEMVVVLEYSTGEGEQWSVKSPLFSFKGLTWIFNDAPVSLYTQWLHSV